MFSLCKCISLNRKDFEYTTLFCIPVHLYEVYIYIGFNDSFHNSDQVANQHYQNCLLNVITPIYVF